MRKREIEWLFGWDEIRFSHMLLFESYCYNFRYTSFLNIYATKVLVDSFYFIFSYVETQTRTCFIVFIFSTKWKNLITRLNTNNTIKHKKHEIARKTLWYWREVSKIEAPYYETAICWIDLMRCSSFSAKGRKMSKR